MPKDREAIYVTTMDQAAAAVAAGALTGGLLTGAAIFGAPLAHGGLSFFRAAQFIHATIIAGLIAAVFWLLGLIMFGVGPWAVLHHYGWRGWRSATLLGAVAPFSVVTLAIPMQTKPVDPSRMAQWVEAAATSAASFIGVGVAVALVIWRVAYRRAPA